MDLARQSTGSLQALVQTRYSLGELNFHKCLRDEHNGDLPIGCSYALILNRPEWDVIALADIQETQSGIERSRQVREDGASLMKSLHIDNC